MTRILSVLSLLAVVLLAGCATSHPEERGYSAEESRQLALEALNRRGLTFEQYNVQKEQILHPQLHAAAARSEFGDANVSAAMAKAGQQG